MNESDGALWRRIEAFALNDPADHLTFSGRLARENGWDAGFAGRVVEEYKRFVFLAMTAGHEVTPSDEVDQAWHLHLTYTRSYWEGLCGGVLGRPLHHGPTKGGTAEGQRFERQYERTLASYRAAFGQSPPADVWPSSEVRFADARDFVRVNRRRVWLLPKPWRLTDRRPLALAGAWIMVGPPIAAGATINPLDFDGEVFLAFFGAVALGAVGVAAFARSVLRDQGGDPSAIDPHDPLTLAMLRGGWQGGLHSAMARLLRSGALQTEHGAVLRGNGEYRFAATRGPLDGEDALTRTILASATNETLATISAAAEPIAREREAELEKLGLLETAATFRPALTTVGLILGSTLLLGIAKVCVGIGRDKPVGFLVHMLIALAFAMFCLLRKPHRTQAGNRALARCVAEHPRLRERAKQDWAAMSPDDAALAVALFGVSTFSGGELLGLGSALPSTPSESDEPTLLLGIWPLPWRRRRWWRSGGGSGGFGGGGGGGGGCGGCAG